MIFPMELRDFWEVRWINPTPKIHTAWCCYASQTERASNFDLPTSGISGILLKLHEAFCGTSISRVLKSGYPQLTAVIGQATDPTTDCLGAQRDHLKRREGTTGDDKKVGNITVKTVFDDKTVFCEQYRQL